MLRLILLGLIVVGVVYLINRAAAEREPLRVGDSVVLRYGKSLRGAATGLLVMCVLITQQLVRQGTLVDFWLAIIATLLLSWLTLESWFSRIVLDDDGLRTRSPWRRRRSIPWTQVTECKFSQKLQRWVLDTRDFGKVRLSAMLVGADIVRGYAEQRQIPISGL